MPRKTKFVMGDTIQTIGELDTLLRAGEWVYWLDPAGIGGRPKHPGWLLSMSLFTLQQKVNARKLRRAIPRDLAVVCGYGNCGNDKCPHYHAHLPWAGCNLRPITCAFIYGPVRCVPLEKYEAIHGSK